MLHAVLFLAALSQPAEDPEVLAAYAAAIVDAELYKTTPSPLGQEGFIPPAVVDPPLHLGPPWISPHILFAWRDRHGTCYLVVSDVLGNKIVSVHCLGAPSWSHLSFGPRQ